MKNKKLKKTILVVGASGATGRLLVDQLLERGHEVKAIVRNPGHLPDFLKDRKGLTIITASLLDLTDEEMTGYVEGCNAVASCLGHNMTLKGVFGKPRRLVKNAVRRLCEAIKANKPEESVRFILMNTTGNTNRNLDELVSLAQKAVIGLLRLLLPPHADNEEAADYLRTQIGPKDECIQWTAVRPDSLVDMDTVTEYKIFPSPTRSAIFDAGQTSRINVAHFMSELITTDSMWKQWMDQMPVIYNSSCKE